MPTTAEQSGGDRFRAGWAAVEKTLRNADAHGICYWADPSPEGTPAELSFITWTVSAGFGGHIINASAQSHSPDDDGVAIVEAGAALIRAFLSQQDGVPA